MATFTKEFEPLEHISRILTLWWVIVLCAVLGGAAGLIIHQFKPPLYEAQAVFMASIDFTKIDFSRSLLPSNPYQFSQYDEDISLALVEASLRHVEPQVVTFAQNNNLAMDVGAIEDMSTIERKHAFWYLRFRSSDPAIAQKVVNYWAQTGLADLKTKKAANLLPVYIFFDLNQLADLPSRPTYFQTNSFVLAGIVIGLIFGLFLVNIPIGKIRRDH